MTYICSPIQNRWSTAHLSLSLPLAERDTHRHRHRRPLICPFPSSTSTLPVVVVWVSVSTLRAASAWLCTPSGCGSGAGATSAPTSPAGSPWWMSLCTVVMAQMGRLVLPTIAILWTSRLWILWATTGGRSMCTSPMAAGRCMRWTPFWRRWRTPRTSACSWARQSNRSPSQSHGRHTTHHSNNTLAKRSAQMSPQWPPHCTICWNRVWC
mmetsp:Transcript_1460/g.3917  ORF Transcript_1460/g.3917 Transcript_1460/m.3917 type:complete len:210 (-) Transcript_1460:780-1409(-)